MNCEEHLSVRRQARFILKLDLVSPKTCLRLSILGQPGPFLPGRIRAGSSIFHHTRLVGETKVRLFAILPHRAFDFFVSLNNYRFSFTKSCSLSVHL
jgi:hypothetical protein